MKTKFIFIIGFLFFQYYQLLGQHIAFARKDMFSLGISVQRLDSIYKSAVHTDTSQAVFKTEEDQNAMLEAYSQLLQSFGKFLTKNNFTWEKPTKA